MVWQIVTNGAYRSIEHRATVNSIKERLSVATFYSPKLNEDMLTIPLGSGGHVVFSHDASNQGLGCVLMQHGKVIAYVFIQ